MPFLFYVLMTWTTYERRPLITQRIAVFLGEILPGIARSHGANLLETGMVNDHVHVLLRLPPRYDLPRLAQKLKGTTARMVNRERLADDAQPFHWARGYDVRTVGLRGLNDAKEYLRGQFMRHPNKVPH
jgi:putative transposase